MSIHYVVPGENAICIDPEGWENGDYPKLEFGEAVNSKKKCTCNVKAAIVSIAKERFFLVEGSIGGKRGGNAQDEAEGESDGAVEFAEFLDALRASAREDGTSHNDVVAVT